MVSRAPPRTDIPTRLPIIENLIVYFQTLFYCVGVEGLKSVTKVMVYDERKQFVFLFLVRTTGKLPEKINICTRFIYVVAIIMIENK